MRITFTIWAILLSQLAWANMASPVEEGTLPASPFISQHVDILRETMRILPDARFETARFEIEYHLRAHRPGRQVPLLFYASEYREQFRIWVDGREIQLSEVPGAYDTLEGAPFADFDYLFAPGSGQESVQVAINDSPLEGFSVVLADLKFFAADLSEGEHLIRVEYVANRWVDHSGWINQYSFRYALSPAKYWKSFGELEITLDASAFPGSITTNLGAPATGDLQSIAVWQFSSLPVQVLRINYQPAMPPIARTLLAISPLGLTIFAAILFLLLHLLAMRAFRRAHPENRFSGVMIVGSIAAPLLVLLVYVFSFSLIDLFIGPAASRNHGYTFLAVAFYPLLLLGYWTAMWLVDRTMARRERRRREVL